MIVRPGANCSAIRHVALAAAFSLVPVTALGKSADLAAASLPADKTIATVDPQPVVIVAGRAMDLVGQPVSMVPKGGPAIRGRDPKAMAGLASLPSGAPLWQNRITSGFGYRSHPILGGFRLHSGIDMGAPTGSRVYATMDGYVSHADWAGGYGLSVRLTGNNAVETRYSHLAGIAVGAGSYVRKGDLLGYVGSTGLSTGPHLHYEVRVNGRAIDPRGTERK